MDFFLYLLFFMSFLLVFWTYIGYPLLLVLLSFFIPKEKELSQNDTFNVSLIITAFNEESNIAEKLDNCLTLDYPQEKLEIIVVSDGSTDRTNTIIRQYESKGIKSAVFPENRGKHFAQKHGIKLAAHDILVFTDAATLLEKDAIQKIIQNFSDPYVGCVSGMDKTNNDIDGESVYVKYEMMLRSLESSISSLLGVSGSFFAVRKRICKVWHNHLTSDFFIPIEAFRMGYRIKLVKEAIGRYKLSQESGQEFWRKVRTVVHGLNVLFHYKHLLNPFRYKFYAFQMFSHKLLRWLAPFNMLLFLLASLLLAGSGIIFKFFVLIQLLFYMAAIAPMISEKAYNISVFRIPFFLVMVHIAMLVAWWKFLLGEKYTSWKSTER